MTGVLWPSKVPISGREKPDEANMLAKEWRRSCSRRSGTPAAVRRAIQALSICGPVATVAGREQVHRLVASLHPHLVQ